MLTPQQVLALLAHSDHDVRLHAADFFGRLADASPPETAAYMWQAIDQFGDVAGLFGIKERTSFLRILKELPQAPASMQRALELLREGTSDENTTANLFRLFLALPVDFVEQHRDEILTRVDGETRGQIHHRLELHSMTGEQIWEQLSRLGEETEKARSSSEVDFATASRLVAAMAAHPELAIARAMEVLDASGDRYWPETWCIELLGKLRHSPAIDVIIRKMAADQGDFMHGVAAAALGRMDAQLSVPKLRNGYENQIFELEDEDESDIYFRMRFSEALGKTPDPLAEAALIQLLEKETDPELISSICGALMDLCSTEGLEQLRRVVVEEKYDGSLCDVKEELVMLCKMVGFEPPELPQWEKEVKDRKRDAQRRTSMLKKIGLSRGTFDQFLSQGAKPPQRTPSEPMHSNEPVHPFRRDEPKIGRNDPCPCGSGKKYKKCCGK